MGSTRASDFAIAQRTLLRCGDLRWPQTGIARICGKMALPCDASIENVRLLNELRARTDQLGRSVEELRALGDVTQAVNSTLDLQNVLDTIVAKATQQGIRSRAAVPSRTYAVPWQIFLTRLKPLSTGSEMFSRLSRAW
jgi:hypothetical protein